MKNKTLLIIISVLLTFVCIVTPNARGNEISPVNQGDKLITVKKDGTHTLCTVGYVDKISQTAIYTGHCSHGDVGNKVMNEKGEEVGNVIQNFYVPPITYTDYAVIKLTVPVGNNIYSGDKISLIPALPGDNICSYGGTSNQVYCGKVTGSEDIYVVQATRNSGGTVGDSGGPAWVEGKGIVGFLSGLTEEHTFFTYRR